MHGDKDSRLDLFSDVRGFFGVNGEKPPYGDQKNVHGADLNQFFIAQEVAEVPEVTELNMINPKGEDGVGSSFVPLRRIMVGCDTFNRNFFNHFRTASLYNLRPSRKILGVIMIGVIMTG